jgi:hypothetical protein
VITIRYSCSPCEGVRSNDNPSVVPGEQVTAANQLNQSFNCIAFIILLELEEVYPMFSNRFHELYRKLDR